MDNQDEKQMYAEMAVESLLQFIGEDKTRDGLKDTPRRYAKMLYEFLNPEPFSFTVFEETQSDEMVIVKDIPFYSFCEHHLLPFFGTAAIAYIPRGGKIVGISKLPRCLHHFARRLQNQERITRQVMEMMNEMVSADVAVMLSARHMCMEMRGIKVPGAVTITNAMSGSFKTDAKCRQEFLNLIK